VTDSRPISAETQLRRTVLAGDSTISVISTSSFSTDARKLIGDEIVQCTGFGVDSFGWPIMTGCIRGLSPEEGGVDPQEWPAGTPVFEIPWTTVEIVDTIPIPSAAMIGRQFVYRDAEGNTYAFSIALTQNNTPYIDWVNEPPVDSDPEAGATIITLANAKTGFGDQPHGITLNPANTAFYMSDRDDPVELEKFSISWVSQWVATLTFGGGTHKPGHVYHNGTSLFFVDNTRCIVTKFADSNGAFQAEYGTGFGVGNLNLNNPTGIAGDGTNIYIADVGNNRVLVWTLAGVYVGQITGLVSPRGICMGPSNTHIYVLNSGAGNIKKYLASTLALVSTISLGIGNGTGQISSTAEGINIDALGQIWIADTGNHRIQLIDETAGASIAQLGEFGTGFSQFQFPRQIAFSNDGINGYVADSGNFRIVRLNSRFIESGGTGAKLLVPFVQRGADLDLTNATWQNIPAGVQELFNRSTDRKLVDLAAMTKYRLVVEVASLPGSTNTVLFAQYTSNIPSPSWLDLGDSAQVNVSTVGWKDTGWVDLATGARITGTLLRIAASGGNGSFDVPFPNIALMFK
jgi:hypothetical protein